MNPVTDEQLEKLAPFIAGSRPDARGEVEMYCPLHNDSRRSASVNVNKGAWYCHAGCGGGSVRHLIDSADTWVPLDGRELVSQQQRFDRKAVKEAPSIEPLEDADVDWWHLRLMADDMDSLTWLWNVRGISAQTARKALLGFDGRCYKLPVFGPERELLNIRTYDPSPGATRRKIWGVRGHNTPQLYPRGVIERAAPGSAVIVCEGEWDALLTLQTGYQAITRTGAARVWEPSWTPLFTDMRVFICHDADDQGEQGNRIVYHALKRVAAECTVVALPYTHRRKHGKDLTDFLLDADEPAVELGELLRRAGQ